MRYYIFIILVLLGGSFTTVLAQTATTTEDLKQNIETTSVQIQSLEQEIAAHQKELEQIAREKLSAESEFNRINTTSKKLQTDLSLTRKKIENTDLTLVYLEKDIRTKEQKIQLANDALRQSIRRMYEVSDYSMVELAFGGEKLSDVWSGTDNLVSFQIEVHNWIADLEGTKKQLRDNREEEAQKKVELDKLKSSIVYEKQAVDVVRDEKNLLLQQVEAKEETIEEIIAEKERLRKQFEEELYAAQAELKYILDPTSFPPEGTRVFSWPLERSILITQPFGKTKDSAALYAYRKGKFNGRHSGLDLRANNDKVVSMADGVVVGIGDTDKTCPRASFGKWVLIKYDNGLSSIYSHLSLHTVEAGQRVARGDLVAYSGNTGYSTGPHLDVKVVPADAVSIQTWPSKGCSGRYYTTPLVAGSQYFDPLSYLPPTTRDMYK